jgi:hypothetical protein
MAGRVAPYIDNTGLVFAYDQSNTVRSYLGEPTVNYCSADSNLVANIDCSTANATAVLPNGDIGTVRRVTVVADTYGGIIRASLNHNLPSSGIPQAGQSYTISCWIRNSSGVAVAAGWEPEVGQPDGYLRPNVESGFNGNYAASSQPNTLSSNWTRVSYTYSYTSTQTSQIVPFIYFGHPVGGSGSGVGATIDFYQIQIEVKSHATPFVNGTRSATQGLKDLTGNSTIDLSNVSFDSNAQMTFDGTDDIINVTAAPWNILQTFTLESVFKANGTAGSGFHVLFQKEGGFSGGAVYGLRANNAGGNLLAMVCYDAESASQNFLGSSTLVTNGKYYHVLSTFDSSYNWKLYINGVLENSSTLTAVPFQNTSRVSIGRGDGRTMNGDLPIAKIYNRALTASEIQQNFNAVRGRYGI